VATREDFAVWMCQRHNEVNKLLDKPLFDCEYSALYRRWRDGGEACSEPDF